MPQSSSALKRILLSVPIALLAIALLKFWGSHWFAPSSKGLSGLRQEAQIDYLFIGSSQTRQHIVKKLEPSLGRVYVLAYNDCNLFYINFLVSIIVEEVPVRHIVAEAYPYRAMREPGLSDVRMFNELTATQKLAFFKYSEGLFTPAQMYELCMLSGNESMAAYPFLYRIHQRLAYKGGYVGKYLAGMGPEAFQLLRPPLTDTIYTGIHIQQQKAVQALSALCQEKGIQLYFLEPPVPAPVQNSLLFTKARRNLQALSPQTPHFHAGHYGLDLHTSAFFCDSMHLSSEAIGLYSEKVGALLKNYAHPRQ